MYRWQNIMKQLLHSICNYHIFLLWCLWSPGVPACLPDCERVCVHKLCHTHMQVCVQLTHSCNWPLCWMVISYDACRKWQRLNVTMHHTSVDNLFPKCETGGAGWTGSWQCSDGAAPVVITRHRLNVSAWIPERKHRNLWKDGSLKPLAQSGLLTGTWQSHNRSWSFQHLVELCGWIVCIRLRSTRLSASWQPRVYVQRETTVTYKVMALFRYGGMRARLAADRSTLIFTQKKKEKTFIASLSLLRSLATWVARFPLDFPMPCYLFSSLNLFILSAGSRQPPKLWASC